MGRDGVFEEGPDSVDAFDAHAVSLVGYDLLMFLGPVYHAGLHHHIVGAHLGRQ
jgi:hypothetical protein